jgi:hypothetical protein
MQQKKPRPAAAARRASIGRDAILRFNGGVRRDPAVSAWFMEQPAELRSIARTWFAQMRRCGADVLELVHDGCPVACIADAPFAYVDAFTAHVNVGFFHGAALADPARLLQGSGKRMRHVKVRPGGDIEAAALRDLIDAAYVDIKRRLGGGR